MKNKRLYRDTENQKIAGVCSGLAAYFDIDVTIIRLGITFLTIFTSLLPGVIFYIIAAVIIPRKRDLDFRDVEEAEYTEKKSNSESIFDE